MAKVQYTKDGRIDFEATALNLVGPNIGDTEQSFYDAQIRLTSGYFRALYGAGQDKSEAELSQLKALNAELREAVRGLLSEWDKLTKYGSPMARAANERVQFARNLYDETDRSLRPAESEAQS